MRISWNWLSDYVDLDGLNPTDVGDALTMGGLELDAIEQIGAEFEPIVVGEILSIDQHPEADRLVVCQVQFGSEPAQIVCGASNMTAQDRVAVIPAGNRLPDGTKIKKGKIRGQVSQGMMCSNRELGLGDDHDGIMILPREAPIGESIANYLGLRDTVFDLSITPNRGDALSYLGVAREVAALYGRERTYPGVLGGGDPSIGGAGGDAADQVQVIIDDPDGCPRYAAGLVFGVEVGPSPAWMVRRLEAMGQRSVNNLVDISNYVMFETGQPLHIFDLAKLNRTEDGQYRIEVRRARPGETLTSIDHVERQLREDDLLITDGSTPIAVAGVMGGFETEVSETTRDILVECAHFDPQSVRRTSKHHGLVSESSHRFERTVDPEGVPTVMSRTLELILATQPEGSDPRVAQGMVDAYPRPFEGRVVHLRVERCNNVLGTTLTQDEMAGFLRRIDIPVDSEPGVLAVRPPAFRPDLEREIDLIEEVGRFHGLDKLQPTVPTGALGFKHQPNDGAHGLPQPIVPPKRLVKLERVRDLLADAGLFEAVNLTFASPATISSMGFATADPRSKPVRVANPLSEISSAMRTTLLTGLLRNAHHNLAHQARSVRLFEIGPVFLAAEDAPKDTGVRQDLNVAIVLAGESSGPWSEGERTFTAQDLKRKIDALAEELNLVPSYENHGGEVSYLHPGVGALISIGGNRVGVFGQLHPRVAESFDLHGEIFVLEASLDALLAAWNDAYAFEEVPRFPAATRDLAFVVDSRLPFSAIQNALSEFKNALLESIDLSSMYAGEQIPEGKKSVALKVTYRSNSGSLTEKKIDAVHQRLAAHLLPKLNADLR